MKRRARVLPALVFALLCAAALPAGAQSNAEARSRTLFQQGRQLADAGRWDEACPLFQAAHDLHSTGGTALQAANCYEKTGKLDRALALYQFILDQPEGKRNPDRIAIAEERIREIRKQLAPTEPAPAPAPGSATGSAPVTPPATATATAPAPAPAPPDAATTPPSRFPAYLLLGAGGAGLMVGGVAGALALAQASDVESACTGTRCPPEQEPHKDAAVLKSWISTIGFGVGVTGVALGVVLLVTSGTEQKQVTADARGVTIRF
jgi:tetratricopeptide (TPR) repeat protein